MYGKKFPEQLHRLLLFNYCLTLGFPKLPIIFELESKSRCKKKTKSVLQKAAEDHPQDDSTSNNNSNNNSFKT